MNRLFYRPEHCGVPKTTAAASVLSAINPDVELETFNINITTVEGFRTFKKSLVDEKTGESRVALVLSCVDNYEARIHINRVCLDLSQPWMESGVSEDAVSGMSAFLCAICMVYCAARACAFSIPCSAYTCRPRLRLGEVVRNYCS